MKVCAAEVEFPELVKVDIPWQHSCHLRPQIRHWEISCWNVTLLQRIDFLVDSS